MDSKFEVDSFEVKSTVSSALTVDEVLLLMGAHDRLMQLLKNLCEKHNADSCEIRKTATIDRNRRVNGTDAVFGNSEAMPIVNQFESSCNTRCRNISVTAKLP